MVGGNPAPNGGVGTWGGRGPAAVASVLTAGDLKRSLLVDSAVQVGPPLRKQKIRGRVHILTLTLILSYLILS